MESLPPELLYKICSLVAIGEARLAKYATISRAWQRVIEDRTFSHLSLVNDELHFFESAVLKSTYEYRRMAIGRVDLIINLPSYDDHACGRFERQADRHINDQAFSKAIAHLFGALATIDIGGRFGLIDLHLQRVDSAMDRGRRDSEKLRADKLAMGRGRRKDLFELRYRDSYLQLLDPGRLPLLYNIASLTINGDNERKLAPSTVVGLMSRLPNLPNVNCVFSDNERRRPDQRRHLRSQLSEQLTTMAPPKGLKRFNVTLTNRQPFNSNFLDADIRGGVYATHADDLSTGFRLFSKAAPCLTNFILNGPISVGPDIFWPSNTTDPDIEKCWEHLTSFTVKLSAVRPDGGWYIELDSQRDTESSDEGEEDDQDEEDEEEEEDHHGTYSEDSLSSYDSSDSFFATDQQPPDSYGYADRRRDERLKGNRPSTSNFRTKPTRELETLFLAAADAASQMPMLEYMCVSLEIRPSGRTGRRFRRLGFQYRAAKRQSDYPGPSDRRLQWNVPRDWRMSQELEQQWLSLLGADGIVVYDEW